MLRLPLSLRRVLLLLPLCACTSSSPTEQGEAEASSSEEESSSGDGDGDMGDGDADAGDGDGDGTGDGDGDPMDEPAPPQPDWLTVYTTGNPEDAQVEVFGPGLILMGGNFDVDEAFSWQAGRIPGGDLVVIRVSGSDGYNDYLYSDIGGVDSVQTLILDSPAAAQDPWVAWTIEHAEALWMPGGDQADYLELWKDTPVQGAIMSVYERGGIVGGTSAGLAVLGEWVFAAYNGTVYPEETLEDPYNMYMQMERDFLALPLLAGVITDTHFAQRNRMGRLLGFAARVLEDGWGERVVALGVDEDTAMVVGPDGIGRVLGDNSVYLFSTDTPAASCEPGVPLEFGPLMVHRLEQGDSAQLPEGTTEVPGAPVEASGGVTIPADPY